MLTRRSMMTIAGGVAFNGLLSGSSVRAANPEPLGEQQRWQLSPTFFFQKSVRRGGFGIPEEPFPVDTVKKLISSRAPEAYYEIRKIFAQYVSNPIDPAGALLTLPSYAEELVNSMPSPPLEGSKLLVAELLELYWAAAFRDVAFGSYENNSLAKQAFDELAGLGLYTEPNYLSRRQLFASPWALDGTHYISAFMLANIPKWPLRQKQLSVLQA